MKTGVRRATRGMIFASVSSLVVLLSLTACSRSPTVEYYVLSPASNTRPPANSAPTRLVAVAVPGMPSYINQNEIVERLPKNTVQIHEYQRWATDLDDMLRDFFVAALQARISQFAFVSSDTKLAREAEQRWEGVFSRFDIHQGSQIELELSWHLARPGRQSARLQNRITVVESLQDASVTTLVNTLTKALEKISDEIAGHLQHEALEVP